MILSLLEQALQALVEPADDAVLVRVDPGHVDADQVGLDAELLALAGLVGDLGRVQQRLGRDAAAVQAGAAQLGLVDQRHREVQLGRAQGGGVSAAAGAEDHDVEGSAAAGSRLTPRIASLPHGSHGGNGHSCPGHLVTCRANRCSQVPNDTPVRRTLAATEQRGVVVAWFRRRREPARSQRPPGGSCRSRASCGVRPVPAGCRGFHRAPDHRDRDHGVARGTRRRVDPPPRRVPGERAAASPTSWRCRSTTSGCWAIRSGCATTTPGRNAAPLSAGRRSRLRQPLAATSSIRVSSVRTGTPVPPFVQ